MFKLYIRFPGPLDEVPINRTPFFKVFSIKVSHSLESILGWVFSPKTHFLGNGDPYVKTDCIYVRSEETVRLF